MEQTINATHTTTAIAVSIFGMATGLTYEALFAGFAGALCSLSFLSAMTGWGRIWTVFTSTVFSGYLGPVLALAIEAAMLKMFPHLADFKLAFFLGPFLTGLAAQGLIPIVSEGLKRFAGKTINGAAQ